MYYNDYIFLGGGILEVYEPYNIITIKKRNTLRININAFIIALANKVLKGTWVYRNKRRLIFNL